MRHRLMVLSAMIFLPASAGAQVDCTLGHLPKNSHEAKMLANFAVPLAFSPAEAPNLFKQGTVRVSLEASYLPKVDSTTRTPTYCKPNKMHAENTDLLFAFPRPRVYLVGSRGFGVEVSWVPPVRLHGVKANLFSFAVGRAVAISDRAVLNARIHAVVGSIRAPITCDKDAVKDTGNTECFQQPVSDDKYRPNNFGVDGSIGWSLGGGRLRPYLGGGYNLLHPRFQVTSTQQKIEVNLTRAVLFGGATWAPTPAFAISGEVYSAPSDAVTGRVTLSYAFQR